MRRIVLFGFVLLIISVVITLNIFFQQNYQREMAEQLNRQQALIAKAVSTNISGYLEHIEEEMQALSRTLGRRGLDPVGLEEFVEDVFAEESIEEGVTLKVLDASARQMFPVGERAQSEDVRMFYLARDIKPGNNRFFDHTGDHAMVEIASPIHDDRNRFLGLVLVGVHTDAINSRFLEPITAGDRGYAWMMDDKGTLIYHPTQSDMLGKNIYSADESCYGCHKSFHTEKMILSTPSDIGFSSYVSPMGEDKLVAFARVSLPRITWFVCVTIPYSEVTSRIQDSMRLHSLLVLFIFAMTVVGAIIVVINNKSRIKAEEKALHLEKERVLESQIVQAKNYLENILENTQALIMVIRRNLTIRTINTACEGICGQSTEDVRGRPFVDVFPFSGENDRERFLKMIAECLEGEVKQIAEYPLTCGDRRTVISLIMSPLRIHGEIEGVILSGSDISEEAMLKEKIREYASELEVIVKERTNQLLSEKEKLNALVEAIEAGIGIFRSDGQVEWANRVLDQWLPEGASMTLELGDVFAGRGSLETVLKGIREKQLWQDVLYRDFGRKAGYFQVTASPLARRGGDEQILLLIQDVTDIRRAEEQMIQSEKLSALARLSAGVAHEIGNPLTSISSYVQILEEGEYDEFTSEALKTISRQINRIALIVRQMSSFTKVKETDVRAQDVYAIIDRTLQLIRYDRRMKNVDIVKDIPESVPKVMVNGDQLEQVFINIVLNSGDAMSGEGRLEVRVKPNGKFLEVDFSDSGPGIPPDRIERIFDPFYTTKENGTGLGLSVSYTIVRSFGGSITASSKPGEGSIFRVRLPIYEG